MFARISLVILGAWLALTLFTDFVVIRTAFAITGDFFKAGDLGIALFNRLNDVEIFFGSFLVVAALKDAQVSGMKRIIGIILSLLLLGIALTYFSYLTPKITELTEIWKEAEALGVMNHQGVIDVQGEHQFYHRLYIGLDSVKIMTLLGLLGIRL